MAGDGNPRVVKLFWYEGNVFLFRLTQIMIQSIVRPVVAVNNNALFAGNNTHVPDPDVPRKTFPLRAFPYSTEIGSIQIRGI